MFRTDWFAVVEEVRGERDRLESHSYQALQNMLGYCQGRVIQLASQRRYLDFQAQQQYDLHQLLETWGRLDRAQQNYHRFAERCLLIKLELVRREQALSPNHRQGDDHEA